jgi:hypothetical protein
MAAHANAVRDSRDGQENQVNAVILFPESADERGQGATGESGLNRKSLSTLRQLGDSLQHHSAGRDPSRCGIEGGKPLCDDVGIHKIGNRERVAK